jgi:DNA-nicking Smr family endonuclease
MAGRTRKSGAPAPTPSEDGRDLWDAVKAGTRPVRRDTVFRDSLAGSSDAVPPAAPAPKKPKGKKTTARPAAAPSLPAALPAPPPKDLAHGCAPGVDRRTAERLKRGRLPIEARLDLHGMSREAAHQATRSFVSGARAAGKRCVLIVTGKGKGILQSDLPRWLNMAPLRHDILSFTHARPQDGGTGAVYVLLKRHR